MGVLLVWTDFTDCASLVPPEETHSTPGTPSPSRGGAQHAGHAQSSRGDAQHAGHAQSLQGRRTARRARPVPPGETHSTPGTPSPSRGDAQHAGHAQSLQRRRTACRAWAGTCSWEQTIWRKSWNGAHQPPMVLHCFRKMHGSAGQQGSASHTELSGSQPQILTGKDERMDKQGFAKEKRPMSHFLPQCVQMGLENLPGPRRVSPLLQGLDKWQLLSGDPLPVGFVYNPPMRSFEDISKMKEKQKPHCGSPKGTGGMAKIQQTGEYGASWGLPAGLG
ncbi:uncharacterized protein [Symphalangus syndactylus]|uniref:uncharacterized protein n=1 Tax=Symphalangus syndactylus TaxID=9590 RepID=UPI003004033A